jgi:hypothetical protein
VFTVAQGPRFRVGTVDIAGCEQLARGSIQTALRVQPGQPFVAARMIADADVLRALYRQQGFRAVEVTAGAEPAGGDPQLAMARHRRLGPWSAAVPERVSAFGRDLQAAVSGPATPTGCRSTTIVKPSNTAQPLANRCGHDPDRVQRRRHPRT